MDDWNEAAEVLKGAGYVYSTTPVLAVAIPDEPGGLCRVLELLGRNGINVEYTYAFITRNEDLAYMIFRVEDNEKAAAVLEAEKLPILRQQDLSDM